MIGESLGSGIGTVVGGLANEPEDYYAGIQIPAIEELIRAGKIDATAFDHISTDPSTRDAQMRALAELSNEGSRGGASLQSKAAQAQLMDAAATRERMNREAVLRDMASRGQAGGGAELAARLMANQEGARRDALSSAQIAGSDRERALQSLQAAGALGGNVRAQDYGQARDRAAARDALAQWNAQNRRSAYSDNMNWTFNRAGGQQQNANDRYKRGVATGGAIGGLAGGALDYATGGYIANPSGGGSGTSIPSEGWADKTASDFSPGGAYEGWT